MKTIYLLFVVLTDQSGYETMLPVSNTKHHSMLECKVEKAQVDYHLRQSTEGQTYKDVKGINGENRVQFFCGDETLYFNKQQVFY